MIQQIELKNFTVFKSIKIDFSSKINVIIGENGTGKTHLLKAIYGLCAGATISNNKPDINMEELTVAVTDKLLKIFMPLDDKLGRLHHYGSTDHGFLGAKFRFDQRIEASFFNNSRFLALKQCGSFHLGDNGAVFIPTKEVLSFMKGFNSLYEKYGLSFDQTYQDICLLLDLPELRPEKLQGKAKWAIEEIEKVCKGRFVFYGGGKVTFRTGNNELSANVMAEGFRKAGTLSRLLETGAIQPGVGGPLLWDEPEANLNPKLMEMLVEILLEMARKEHQIILATHDYVLLKWFDLLTNKGRSHHVRFHSLYRDAQSGEIQVHSTDDYREIERNPISEAFNDLTIAQARSRLKEGDSE